MIFNSAPTRYFYYRKDHLGNNREVWCGNTNTTVQRTQYYPSGLPWAEGLNSWAQNKKYNGKEFVEAHGYDVTDLDARGLHNAKVRFDTFDPMAEKRPWESPYCYAGNNPVNRIDPNGMDYIITINRDKDGNITGITFSATVYITGDGANQKRADQLNDLAKETYKTQEINGVSVGFNVNYEYSDKVKGIGDIGQREGANVLYFEKEDGRSAVNTLDADNGYTGNYGTIYNSTNKNRSNPEILHETGHLLGFDDRYTDIKDSNGEVIGGKVHKGYENDLMGPNAPNLVKSHYQQMYNYVVTPERRENDNSIRMIYFPDLAIKILNRTNKTIGNKFIDKTN